jgi:hypothetical protein
MTHTPTQFAIKVFPTKKWTNGCFVALEDIKDFGKYQSKTLWSS